MNKKLPEAPKSIGNSVNFSGVIPHMLNTMVTLAIGYFVLVGTQGGNNASMLESAFKRMAQQDKIILDLRSELIRTQIQVIELEAKVRRNINEVEMLQGYLNVLPFPAWIKEQRLDDRFEMVMINEAYTSYFGITASQYIGRTDYEVHEEHIAQLYEKHDLQVVSLGREIRAQETIMVRGQPITLDVFKFPIDMPDGSLGVGGVAITHEEKHNE